MRNQEEAAASVGYLLKTLLAETQTYEKTARSFKGSVALSAWTPEPSGRAQDS